MNTYDYIEIKQPIGNIYLMKINSRELINLARADIRKIYADNEYCGIQRELKKSKVDSIKKYLSFPNATFPNSIILNINSKDVSFDESKNKLTILKDSDVFTIIDGQHRLAGFRNDSDNGQQSLFEIESQKHFDLIVSVFLDLELSEQAEIFSVINSEQTKVDPSLNFHLELSSSTSNPIKFVAKLAEVFNYDKNSPWFNQIKMLGSSSEGIISLVAFSTPLLKYICPYDDIKTIKDFLSNKNFEKINLISYDTDIYFLWDFFKTNNDQALYKILLNYFNSFFETFSEEWGDKNSILTKTTGYNAMARLFKDLFFLGFIEGDLSHDFFIKYIIKLNKFRGKLNTNFYGASGEKAADLLYNEWKQELGIEKKSNIELKLI